MTTYGYAGNILRVDLSSRSISTVPTMDYADRFLGGRGIAAKIYWDEVPPETDAFDPENRLIFATGPLCGMPAIGGSRWTICGKTPENSPNCFSYGNLGGIWGAALKFTGYDAIVIQGRSDTPVYLHIHDDTAEFEDASDYWGTGAIETREALKKKHGQRARVAAIGPAGENRAVMAVLTADNDSVCTAGLGAVMGAKNFKAVVVKSAKKKISVAHPEKLKALTQYYRDQGRTFTEYLSRWSRHILNDFKVVPNQEMKKDPCFGCLGRCCRKIYEAENGQKGKFVCHAAFFYQPYTEKYYDDWNDVPFYATKLCDTYGLDTDAVDYMISWLILCRKQGMISDENTGLPFSKLGSLEFIETLVKKISLREGFGDVLANGVEAAAKELGPEAEALVEKAGYLDEPGNRIYGPRLYITNSFMYAMEPRLAIQQVHEIGLLIPLWLAYSLFEVGHVTAQTYQRIAKRFWGSEAAGDLTTYEGKALAAKMIQERQFAKESLILCDYLWPLTDFPDTDDHVGDPTLESKLLSAVTGRDIDETGLYRIGERVFNLQRAVLVREGHQGREHDTLHDSYFETPLEYDISNPDCIVPGKDGEMVSRKGAVLDREKFEGMKDEYYRLRNWDTATGLQTVQMLKGLDLEDVAVDLKKKGLVASTDQDEEGNDACP